jgi:C4-dicarboxylate-specific signal transduction histidine kinase
VRARSLKLLLLLDVAAVAAVGVALLLGLGLPLAARGRIHAAQLALIAVAVAAAGIAVGGVLLWRWVGQPVRRILDAAGAAATAAGELPLFDEESAGGLSHAAVAFERAGAALAVERARLAEKVRDLERTNAELVRARESVHRAEQLATIGRLASGVAHEVGNPLGAITGYVELARGRLRAAPNAAVEDLVARIGAEAERIDGIVRELLDFARPAPLALGAVDLAAAVQTAVRLAEVQSRFREVEVAVVADPGLRVVADARRLSQVVLNLLLNAADAMGGRGRVEVTARPVEAGGRAVVELVLRDTGPGIAPEHLPVVFDPFFTTKAPGQGTGLGLAVCHGIVTSFGGSIRAANDPRGGAAFTVELPRDDAPAR